jgi:uncharacterized protein YndB with AHSA1/START domain
MLKILAIVVAVATTAVLIFAATKPDTFRVERSASIKAPPEKVFALINDYRNWGSWSPWEKMDPEMKRTFSGSTSGKGAVYEWDGNSDVGKGRMEILDTSPPSKVVLKLDFDNPMEAHNTVEFTLAGKGDTTEVTWAMYGPNPFMGKVMHVLFNMDRMIGKQFETGLANMKAVAEMEPLVLQIING